MGFLSTLLGKLPASDSAAGHLNGLDIKKTLRFGIVVFLGAFGLKLTEAGGLEVLTDLLFADHKAFLAVIASAASAGVTAVGAAVIELIRRFVSNQI